MTTIAEYQRDKCSLRSYRRKAVTFVDLLVAFVIIVGVIGFLLPALSSVRESARQAQCAENLKQITDALHAYHRQHGAYPPAYIADKQGSRLHSWRTLILPYLKGGQRIYEEYRFDERWDSPHNLNVAKQMPPTLACPSCGDQQFGSPHGNPAVTNYVAVIGENSIFRGAEPTKHDDMTRGASRTMMVVDVAARAFPWTAPLDITVEEFVASVRNEADRNHPEGIMVAFADKSTRLIAADASPEILNALVACSAGDELAGMDEP